MINKLELSGVHVDVDDKLRRYVTKKIGRLDRYAPRRVRESMHVEVTLKESKAKDKNKCECDVVLHLPGEALAAREATVNMYAAVDIVEAKLRNQLKKYKDMHATSNLRLHHRLLSRLLRKGADGIVD